MGIDYLSIILCIEFFREFESILEISDNFCLINFFANKHFVRGFFNAFEMSDKSLNIPIIDQELLSYV